jgi:hypothetical protein
MQPSKREGNTGLVFAMADEGGVGRKSFIHGSMYYHVNLVGRQVELGEN